jgi:methyltransferase (TIGR00027 family)
MARAAAHGRTGAVNFSDPVALALLSEDARSKVERFRADSAPRGLRARMSHEFTRARANMMVARTVAIDDALRASDAPQVVILGAGLDGRAYRMEELRNKVVFEVDHPDSQRAKRARAEQLTPVAGALHFVPVDFTQQSLDEALTRAGHDPRLATMWLWEGVVMYLAQAEIEATLAVVARRSALGSRLIIAYFSPAPMLWLVGPLVRRLGEPIKSVFTPDAQHALLRRHGFSAVSDQGLSEIGAALSPEIGKATRRMKHLRIVTAERSEERL